MLAKQGIDPKATCPCGRPGTFEECCGPYITGEHLAPDPESLMRSQFTAFALGTNQAIDYLVETHHPDHRDPNPHAGLRASIAGVDAWEKLEVRAAQAQGDRGTVEFVATYRVGADRRQLHELSEFVRESGQWLYTRGSIR